MLFYDFEFAENGKTIKPISLGIAGEDGFELYFVDHYYIREQMNPETRSCSEWVFENVIPKVLNVPDIEPLQRSSKKWGGTLYACLLEEYPLLKKGQQWEFTGYYADYDHVCLSQLWGEMALLPTGMPMWTRDLKQWLDDLGNPQIPFKPSHEHNAIADARWNRDVYRWLVENFDHPAWCRGSRDE